METDQLKVGWRMKATISVDHRVSDGVEAARFMQAGKVFGRAVEVVGVNIVGRGIVSTYIIYWDSMVMQISNHSFFSASSVSVSKGP